jgi:hypothetical protein
MEGGGGSGISNGNYFNNLLVADHTGDYPTTCFLGVWNAPNSVVYNNTIIGKSGGYGIGFNNSATLKNNLVLNADVYISAGASSVFTSDKNVFYGGDREFEKGSQVFYDLAGWKGLGYDASSLKADPKLSGTFLPQAGSSVIGAGANLTGLNILALNTDLAGNPRPSSGAWDVGAYQYITTEVRRPMTDDGKNKEYGKIISPNPIKVVLLKQYLQKNQNLKIYDLAGNPLAEGPLKNMGVYLIRENTDQVIQKVVIIK